MGATHASPQEEPQDCTDYRRSWPAHQNRHSPACISGAIPRSAWHSDSWLGETVSQLRILHFSFVAGVLALLLAGCGSHSTADVPPPSSPGTSPATQPSTEGTGLESPQAPGHPGVSVVTASLPVGGHSSSGDSTVCVDVSWLGKLPSTITVTVTSVTPNPDPPFRTIDLAAAGCTADDGPPCAGLTFTAADNDGGTSCAVGIGEQPGGTADQGTVALVGKLGCPDPDSAICQQTMASLDASRASASFDLQPPDTSSPTGDGSPPDAGSPPDTSSP
jgi:hypothetical protein